MVRANVKTLSHSRKGRHFNPYKSYKDQNLRGGINTAQEKTLTLDKAAEKYRLPRYT